MKFTPKYTITNKILSNLRNINKLIGELNGKKFSQPILYKLETEARNISTHASTSIEGNRSNLTEVRIFLKTRPKNIKDTQREILNYNNALEFLNKKILEKHTHLDNRLIIKTHRIVTDKLIPPSNVGKYRKDSVVVSNPLTREVVYLPPDVKDVKSLMDDLVSFVNTNQDDMDPLILSGIFHKQFVIIHPFMDGNGRTCRLLTNVLLAKLGVDTFNLFSFENFYNKNVSKYFELVGLYCDYYDLKNEIDFTNWLEYFTFGILDEILRIKKELENTKLSPKDTLLKDQDNLLEYIHINGYITDKKYAEITERAKATRVIDFNNLISSGHIKREGKGRNTYYILKD